MIVLRKFQSKHLIFSVQNKDVKRFIPVNVARVLQFHLYKICVLKRSKITSMVRIFFLVSNFYFFSFCSAVCRTHFKRLPYDIVKPILDAASPEQLDLILLNNPVRFLPDEFPALNDLFVRSKDYVDDAEPLWQNFCTSQFKDAQRDECETYHELYSVISTEISSVLCNDFLRSFSVKFVRTKNDYNNSQNESNVNKQKKLIQVKTDFHLYHQFPVSFLSLSSSNKAAQYASNHLTSYDNPHKNVSTSRFSSTDKIFAWSSQT